MFCSECGKEVSGKFCCHCGTKLVDIELESTVFDESLTSSNVNYDLLLEQCDYSKTKAIMKLKEITGLELKACQELLDESYKKYLDSNPKLKYEKKASSSSDSGLHVSQAQWEAEKAAYQQSKELQKVQVEEKSTIVKCPKCGSTSLSANKKGFGFGKATGGLLMIGPAGLLAGGIGAGKVMVTCLSCGHSFKAGKI